ncbi:MAG: hypothetical protein HFE75_15045 [Firmicutes bacterium]|jgi:hypothetical protein|nr:hypothetical protein [Bacillota bacterium]
MSCKKNYCPNGLTACCKDCAIKGAWFCEEACEGADQENCKNYRDESTERKKRKEDRKTFRWLLLILAVVLLLFGAALLQTWRTATYIGDVEKQTVDLESGLRTGRG